MVVTTRRRPKLMKRARLGRSVVRLELAGDALPTEFRIWKVGLNTTANGYDVLWDEAAAEATMAAYAKHGVDLMIDLNHLSLDDEKPHYDPDARGWFQLELRDGELWAVNVRWTPEGAERLRNKTQRYTSPAFALDEDMRCVEIVNVALVSMPGTDELPALVAAARDLRRLARGPSLGDIQRAISEAIDAKFPPTTSTCFRAWLCEVYDLSVVYELDGKLFEAPYTFDGSAASVGDGVQVRRVYEPITEPDMKLNARQLAQATARARKLVKAGAAPALVIKTLAEGDASGEVAGVDIAALADFLGITANPAQDPAGFVAELMAKLDEISGRLRGDAPSKEAPTDQMPADEAAAAKLMLRQMGVATFTDGAMRLSEWRGIVSVHEAETKKLEADRRAIELTERTALVVRLQKLGAETPATSGLNDGALCKRLLEEPIDALRERVKTLEAISGRSAATPAGAGDASGLTPRDLKLAKEMGKTPEQMLLIKARVAAHKEG